MRKVLKSVLLMTVLALVSLFATRVQAVENSIVDVAAADGRFTQLLGAAESAGLAGMLESNGPFTVFAPTDDAFEALGAETIGSLTETQLRQVLLYHIVQGAVGSEDVVGLSSATTALGQDVGISVEDGTVVLTGATSANVIITDVEAANGVIHVIDAVLIPPSLAPADSDAGGDDGDMGGDAGGDMDAGDMPAPSDDVNALIAAVDSLRGHVQSITANLDGSNQGQSIDCDAFVADYEAIQALPRFAEMSGDIDAALAAGAGIYASCTDGDGKIGTLDWSIARQTFGEIDGSVGGLQETLIEIYGEMDAPAPMPGDGDDDMDGDDAEMPAPSGDGVELLGAVRALHGAINSTVYTLDQSNQGQDIDCAAVLFNYETIRTLPSYGEISAEFAGLRDAYVANRDAALEAMAGVVATCTDGDGKLGSLDVSVTRTSLADIGGTVGRIDADIVASTGEVDTTAPDPVEPPVDEEEEMPPTEEEEMPPEEEEELTDEELQELIEICLTAYIVRGIDVEENGSIPYDETEFFCDFIAVGVILVEMDFQLDQINAGNTASCFGDEELVDSFVDWGLLLSFAPTFVDVPSDVQPIYDAFQANIEAVLSSTNAVVEACILETDLSDEAYNAAKAGIQAGAVQVESLINQFVAVVDSGNGLRTTELRYIKAFNLSSQIGASSALTGR